MDKVNFSFDLTQNTISDFANTLLDSGLSVIPVKDKIPTLQWKQFQTRKPNRDEVNYNDSIALVCGSVSGGVEVIDVDVKNDSSGTLIERLTEAIFKDSPDITDADLLIQSTPSGGCHLIYKCDKIEGNQILAKGVDKKVLIETRGVGGYVCIDPSPGYQVRSGSLTEIPTISREQRENLFTACRSLNEYFEPVIIPKQYTQINTGIPPWQDYNERGNVPELLESHGWTYLRTVKDNQHYCRPDKQGSTSGTWNGQTFYCFTSSTLLEPSKAYSASALFTFLECNKDFSEAAKKLYSLGYGERSQPQHTNTQEIKTIDWKALQIVTEPLEEIPLLSIGNSPIATAGNYSQVIGKKKSRKSLFLTWLTSQYKGDQSKDIILFDTEQGIRHVWKVMDRIKRLTGSQVGTFYLRGKSPSERKAIIEAVVKEYPSRPKIVIIDGIRDLLSNINDPDQVSELLTWLEKLTLENSLHVINVLHMNKTDNNARGHLGSELLNKSEITIELERDEKADCTIIKCESSRDIPFEPFAFRHSDDGLPEIVTIPTAGRVLPDEERKNRLRFAFQDGGDQLNYGDLVEQVKQQFAIGTNKAKSLIAEFGRNGWIVNNAGGIGNEKVYKCLV
ncbi:MAG: bifunctional DNA primase/polymerase [Cyclobacteriaceae bacterium]|nr:bifunctional DNA primase/polymerase [Cyclobacteriaceae bacterium]